MQYSFSFYYYLMNLHKAHPLDMKVGPPSFSPSLPPSLLLISLPPSSPPFLAGLLALPPGLE